MIKNFASFLAKKDVSERWVRRFSVRGCAKVADAW
jgi:hypothetical protein